MGKYGSFPTNLVIHRPYHLTYEVQEQEEGENYAKLRIVPAAELNADALVDTTAEDEAAQSDDVMEAEDGQELALVDDEADIMARVDRAITDENARQTLTPDEIEELKRKGTAAGKELIEKLLLSHTAIDQKTVYSLAKYKLAKERKHMRRFTILPLDVTALAQWMLEDKDAGKILEMRQEAMALIGCWADVHFGGEPVEGLNSPHGGRWLVVDDTSGLLVAALAERMGLLHQEKEEDAVATTEAEAQAEDVEPANEDGEPATKKAKLAPTNPKRPPRDDLEDHYAQTNTITLIHSNPQPNISLLRYFGFDASEINPPLPYHPLFTHILPISWLQLLEPEKDHTYAARPEDVPADVVAGWKTNRRGNYHRKRRRWARAKQIVDSTRAGGFTGLAIASTMDNVSILKHTLPLLAGGSPVAVYSPTIEPLAQLADCFSIPRRAAWSSTPPPGTEGKSLKELETWAGSDEFPVNPTLLVGASIQTSRARPWQVLPGRTHPFMMGRGGADGYIFTGWRAIPAEGRITARGKYQKKRTEG